MNIAGGLNRVPARRGRIMSLFIGTDGVRAGWRVALYLLIACGLFAVLALLTRRYGAWLRLPPMVRTPDGIRLEPSVVLFNELLVGIPLIGASVTMAWLEGTSPLTFGLRGPHRALDVLTGIIGGLLALSALILVLAITGLGSFGAGSATASSAAGWALVFIAVGFIEEYGFRGYLLTCIKRGAGFWPAALFTSLLFGAVHGFNAGETPVGLVTAGAIGLVFCISRLRTGALFWAIGFHAAWDYGESFLYGTHDSGLISAGALTSFTPHGNIWLSGGATGPEGSLICVAITAIVGVAIWFAFRRAR